MFDLTDKQLAALLLVGLLFALGTGMYFWTNAYVLVPAAEAIPIAAADRVFLALLGLVLGFFTYFIAVFFGAGLIWSVRKLLEVKR